MQRSGLLLQRYTAQVTLPFVALLTVLAALSVVIPKGDDVRWINGHHTPFLDTCFSLITNLGDGLVMIPVLLAFLLIRFRYCLMLLIIAIGHGVLASIFKRFLFAGLERPRAFLGDELLHFVPGITVHSAHSFPSGHTATAFCTALLIALVTRHQAVRVVALLLALLVGYSRIYLGQHFLIDVAGGAVLGCGTTYITWIFLRYKTLPAWMDRKLRWQPRRPTPTPQ